MSQDIQITNRALKWLPWLVATSFFMQMLDGTILNTALPAIAKSLGENPLRMQGVLIAYMLTLAIGTPASGWLTDRFGPRRLMAASITLFTIGSLFCAVSPTLNFMIAARVIQGIGGALMMPVGRLVILRLYPKGQLVQVLSLIPIPGLFGSLIGPALGGFLVQYASWHWIFLMNLPVGIAGVAATWMLMPNFKTDKEHKFDFGGFIVFGFSLVMISLALEGLGDIGLSWFQALMIGCVGLLAQAFYWLKLSLREISLFKPDIFKNLTFRIGLIANLFTRLGPGATPFLLPLLLQVVLGYSPLMAGLLMIPMAMASVMAKMLARKLASRFRYSSILMVNTILQGLLISSLALIPINLNLYIFCFQLALLGAINSLQFSFLNTYTLMDLSYEDSGSGNALMSVMMQLSQSLAVGVAAALLIVFQGSATVGSQSDLHQVLKAFHATFLVIGGASLLSATLFIFSPKYKGKKSKMAAK